MRGEEVKKDLVIECKGNTLQLRAKVQKKQETEYLADPNYGKMGGRGKLNVMSALDEQDLPGFSKTREHLLG